MNPYQVWVMFIIWLFADDHPIAGCIAAVFLLATLISDELDSPEARLRRLLR